MPTLPLSAHSSIHRATTDLEVLVGAELDLHAVLVDVLAVGLTGLLRLGRLRAVSRPPPTNTTGRPANRVRELTSYDLLFSQTACLAGCFVSVYRPAGPAASCWWWWRSSVPACGEGGLDVDLGEVLVHRHRRTDVHDLHSTQRRAGISALVERTSFRHFGPGSMPGLDDEGQPPPTYLPAWERSSRGSWGSCPGRRRPPCNPKQPGRQAERS